MSGPPTVTEMQLSALAAAYGLPVERVVEVALSNLAVVASYQMGAEGASAESVFRLLLAPALTAPQGAPEGPRAVEAPSTPAETVRRVLEAAAARKEPFTAKELGAAIGVHPSGVGQVLGRAGWPSEPTRLGVVRRWLPR